MVDDVVARRPGSPGRARILRYLGRQLVARSRPGRDASVEHRRVVPEVAEEPPDAARHAAAGVVVRHDRMLVADPAAPERACQLGAARQRMPARTARRIRRQLPVEVQEDRPGQVAGVVRRPPGWPGERPAHIDDPQVGIVAVITQPADGDDRRGRSQHGAR